MAEPGRPVDNSAKRSAGRTEATTKMHEAAYTIPAHANRAPSTRLRTISGAASAFTCTGGLARPLGSPVPPRHRLAVAAAQHTRAAAAAVPAASFARRASWRSAARRDTYPPHRPPREESKDDDVVPRNPIEARLLARERERKAKKPLTAKDLDNKMAEAEERRQLELEAIKFKGAQFSRPAPGPRRTVDYGEEKDSHK